MHDNVLVGGGEGKSDCKCLLQRERWCVLHSSFFVVCMMCTVRLYNGHVLFLERQIHKAVDYFCCHLWGWHGDSKCLWLLWRQSHVVVSVQPIICPRNRCHGTSGLQSLGVLMGKIVQVCVKSFCPKESAFSHVLLYGCFSVNSPIHLLFKEGELSLKRYNVHDDDLPGFNQPFQDAHHDLAT